MVTVLTFLGVDIGGQENTWLAAIEERNGCPFRVFSKRASLVEVVEVCRECAVHAIAIDAQLTLSPTCESGFRPSDLRLREVLPRAYRHRVASYNSLPAVPVRGGVLASAISPFVVTVLETHPTCCLILACPNTGEFAAAVSRYDREACHTLWAAWASEYGLPAIPEGGLDHDGQLDSLVAATVAWLYHRRPELVERLPVGSSDTRGRGPFVMVKPRYEQPVRSVISSL
jgi:predicted nuclease with RNAse H fold